MRRIRIAQIGVNQYSHGPEMSLIAGLGDMMPPTALAGIFAAQVVGLEKYTPVLKKCMIPCLMIVVWGLLFIIGADILEPFIILG